MTPENRNRLGQLINCSSEIFKAGLNTVSMRKELPRLGQLPAMMVSIGTRFLAWIITGRLTHVEARSRTPN